MKRITLLFSLFIFFILISCEKKDSIDIDIISSFKAIKNEKNWVSTNTWAYYSKKDGRFFITGSKRDPVYYQDENLQFNFYISDISKSNTVSRFDSRCEFIIGGDVVYNGYTIDSTSNNLIQITSIDIIKKQISGAFSIKLIRNKWYSDKADTIQFNDGQFNVQYSEID